MLSSFIVLFLYLSFFLEKYFSEISSASRAIDILINIHPSSSYSFLVLLFNGLCIKLPNPVSSAYAKQFRNAHTIHEIIHYK